jgi:hypothetical protein
MTSEGDSPAPVRPAPSTAEKLKSAPRGVVSDAELREQLILAANHNVVPGEDIEDVGLVRVMLESGIELDDVLYALRCKVDRRVYPGNRGSHHGPSTGSYWRLRQPTDRGSWCRS